MESTVENETPLLNHLRELRTRLIQILIAVAIAFVICMVFSQERYLILAYPLKKVLPSSSTFIATHPIEAWLTYLKTAFFASLFLVAPVLFYHIWKFVAPGLYPKEKKYTLGFVVLSSLLFVGGAVFGYFVVFPFGFEYFVSFTAGTDIQFLPRMQDYLGFAFRLLVAFGIIFELPMVVFFLGVLGIVSVRSLWNFQKYVIVLAFVVSAVLTPPDVLTQIFLGIPIMMLYEIGLFGVIAVKGWKRVE